MRKNMNPTIVLTLALAAALAPAAPALLAGEAFAPREDTEQKLIAVLKSEAALFDKAKACQRLAVVGGRDSVPVLAALLADEKLSHYARFGLEPIPDPSADAALRDALGKLKGRLLVGVINSLGARRDAGSLAALTALLGDADREVASAAVAAIGRIATPEATGTLKKVLAECQPEFRPQVADSCLACAEALLARGDQAGAVELYDLVRKADLPAHLRAAGMRGAIVARKAEGVPIAVEALQGNDPTALAVALGLVRELPGAEVTRALLASLDRLPPERRSPVITALGDRGDREALPAVLAAARSGPEALRIAAIRTLSRLGDASAVPVLLEGASQADAEISQASLASLERLAGQGVDEAIVGLLDKGEVRLRPVLIDLAGRRSIGMAVPALRKASEDPDGEIRFAALRALGNTVGLADFTVLTARILSPRDAREAAAAQEALRVAARRTSDKDACAAKLIESVAGAPAEARVRIIEVLGSVGGTRAVKEVAAAARDADATIRAAARKALVEWPTEHAAPEILALAREVPDDAERIALLRGFQRIVSRVRFAKEERLALCQKAMDGARNDEERKLVLATLAAIPAVETIPLLTAHLSNPALKEDACLALTTIAERVARFQPKESAEAMKKVIEATAKPEVAARAKKVLQDVGGR